MSAISRYYVEVRIVLRAGFRALHRFLVAPSDGNHATRARKLHLEVRIVRHHHELGQGRTTKQRMVWAVMVHHLEPDWFTAKIFLLSEHHLQLDPSHWRAGVPRHDAMEG
jgi:hypothetical protein